jgi:hypothetical protein
MLRILDATRSLGAAAPRATSVLTVCLGCAGSLASDVRGTAGRPCHRQYEALRSNGVLHDAALRRALSWQA